MSAATFIGTFQKILKSEQIMILFLLQFKLLSCTTIEEFMLICKGFKLINNWNSISENIANFLKEKIPTSLLHVLEQDVTTIFLLRRRHYHPQEMSSVLQNIHFFQYRSIY